MARWRAVVTLPDAPDRRQAELVARALHGDRLLEVISVADQEVLAEERQVRSRNVRLFGGELLPDEDDGA